MFGFCSSSALSAVAHTCGGGGGAAFGTLALGRAVKCVLWHKWHVLHVYGWAGGWMLGMGCFDFFPVSGIILAFLPVVELML